MKSSCAISFADPSVHPALACRQNVPQDARPLLRHRVLPKTPNPQTPGSQIKHHMSDSNISCFSSPLFLHISSQDACRLLKLISRKHPLLWHQAQVLIRRAERIIVKPLDMPIASPQRDVVETRNGEPGLGVRRGDEASFFRQGVSNLPTLSS